MSDAETLGWGDRWRAHLEVAAMGAGEDLAAGRVIAAVLPRRTYLERPSPSGRSVGQPIAANIDVVLIVEPTDPTPSVGRVERFAAMSRSAGAEAWLVLTKTDLVAPEVVEEALTGMAPWVAPPSVSPRRTRRPPSACGPCSRRGRPPSSSDGRGPGSRPCSTRSSARTTRRGRSAPPTPRGVTRRRAASFSPDGNLPHRHPGSAGSGRHR